MDNTKIEKTGKSSNRLKKVLNISILGLLFFLILLLVYEYFRITPSNVKFTNITSTSVTVSWNTKDPISATAVYKKGDGAFINLFGIGKQIFYDTRDLVKAELKAVEQTNKNINNSDDISISMSEVKTEVKVTDKGKYYTHHVEIKGLNPETEYSFFVGDELLYRAVKDIDNNTVIKTTKVDESVKTPVPAYGSIYDSMDTELTFDQLAPINDGIVYFNYVDRITGKKSNLFSGVLNEKGNWYIDVAGAVDDEGKPFIETYDTVEGNVYVELNINAGNLGIWRKTENAYVLTPATNTVINMPNAIVDPTIEGSVVRIEEEVQTSVKGASDNILARMIGDDEQNDEPNYVPPCKCPSDYPDKSCPSGKVCQSKEISGTSYCSKTTCYKVKVTTSTTKDCSHFATFDCNSDCYFLNSSGIYEKCNKEAGECNMEKLKTLGLNCNKEVGQENNTCAGGAKLGQCTYVNGEGCKQCKWVQNKWGSYWAIWSGLSDSEQYLCGENQTSQKIYDCAGLPDCTNGKLDLNTNKCICNEGFNWSYDKCIEKNQCESLGQKCTTSDGDYGYCTAKNGLCVLDNSYCSCPGHQEGMYDKGKCVCEREQKDECIKNPTKNGCNCKREDGSVGVYNLAGVCVQVGSPCSVVSINTISYGTWSNDGYCIPNKTPEVPILEASPELYCWTRSGQFYFYNEATENLYKCTNNILTGPLTNDESDLAKSCKAFATSKGTNNSCDSGLFNLAPASYCSYDGVYYCRNNKWQNVEKIGNEGDVIVGAMATISVGEECTGNNILGGNIKCQCSGNVIGDDSGTYSNKIIGIGKWCVEVTPSQCNEISNNEKVCDEGDANTKKVCKDGKCDATKYESGIPQIYTENREPCTNEKCKCIGGPDDGHLINTGQFCREISGSCGEYDQHLNEICNNSGNTCNSSGLCEGDKKLTYIGSYKIIKSGDKCFYSNDEKNNKIYGNDLVSDYLYCKCSDGPDNGKTIDIGKFCRNTASCIDLQDSYNTCIDEKNSENDCIKRVTNQVCNNDGRTCTYPTYECFGAVKSQLINGIPNNKEISSINKSVIDFKNFKVSAQTKTVNSQFIIDQKTGMFVNLPQGEYIFEYEGQQYYFEVTDPYGNKRVYIDKELNGKYDEGTDKLVSDLASLVEIEPIELKYTYVLKEGFNFVSLPFLVSNQEYRTAAGLLKKLNDVYENTIYSIAKYDGSWKVVGQNVELYNSNDFQLVPGQGYVIKVKDDVTIDIWGKPIKYDKDSPNAPVTLFKGWNLIGLYGSGIKQYTAKTLLEDINKYEKIDFSADNVSKWDSELQRYDGFQTADKNGVPTEYGFDYPIYLLNSYFVRVQDGEGNWQPELAQ